MAPYVSVPTCGYICHPLLDRRRHAGGLDGDAAAGQGDVQRVAEPQPHLPDSAPGQPPTLRLQGVDPLSTGFSSEIGAKLRDWAVGQAGGSCYSWAALSSNNSKTRYSWFGDQIKLDNYKLIAIETYPDVN